MRKIIGKITSNSVAFVITFCAIVFGIFTYAKFLSSDNSAQDIETIYVLLIVDFVLLLSLAFILGYKLTNIFIESRKQKIGAKLQRRLIKLFALVLIVPFMLICISYVFSSYLGMQAWFSDKVKTAINESVYVSEAYLEEHNNIIKSDVLKMENLISEVPLSVYNDKHRFSDFLRYQSNKMGLPEIMVFDSSGRVIGETGISMSVNFDPFSNIEELNEARDGNIVIISDQGDDRLFALMSLDGFMETFILVGKFIDPNVLQHVETSKNGARAYLNLEQKIGKMQVAFIVAFIFWAMIILFISIWISFIFADKISAPIVELIKASKAVGKGDFNIKVKKEKSAGEINDLIKSFNLMTRKLEEQQHALSAAHKKAAWGEVAQRIAHEIKNPLTPISLSVDRMKRKFEDEVEDKRVFNSCINTIRRQVDSLGSMINEFSSFARMPDPVFEEIDITLLIKNIAISFHETGVKFSFKGLSKKIVCCCDEDQISRAVTNVIKNSIEALQDAETKNGKIDISLSNKKGMLYLDIGDNGNGIDMTQKITEPYVTSKSAGTGLGLAIVKRIMEDHGGDIYFKNKKSGGALVTLTFRGVGKI